MVHRHDLVLRGEQPQHHLSGREGMFVLSDEVVIDPAGRDPSGIERKEHFRERVVRGIFPILADDDHLREMLLRPAGQNERASTLFRAQKSGADKIFHRPLDRDPGAVEFSHQPVLGRNAGVHRKLPAADPAQQILFHVGGLAAHFNAPSSVGDFRRV